MEQEILVFGGAAVNWILEKGLPLNAQCLADYNCATVLCHPGANYEKVLTYVDAYAWQ